MKETLSFSQTYKIKKTKEDDWFDPILDTDVKLFLDPFLISHTEHPLFQNTHKDIVRFFQHAFKLVATANSTKNERLKRTTLEMLSFPEVFELCLGYSSRSVKGSGAGKGFANLLYESITSYLEMGMHVEEVNQLEIMSIFVRGLGCDRISDITANLLKPYLIKYTQEIAKRHKIEMKKLPLNKIKYNSKLSKWESGYVVLPENTSNGAPVLLVPKYFLRKLPTINDIEFIGYLGGEEAANIRESLHIDITKDMDKPMLKKIVMSNPDYLKNFLKHVTEKIKPTPYDLESDPDFLYLWHATGKLLAEKFPPIQNLIVKNESEFKDILKEICDYFKNCVIV